jgi:hypothetical protein
MGKWVKNITLRNSIPGQLYSRATLLPVGVTMWVMISQLISRATLILLIIDLRCEATEATIVQNRKQTNLNKIDQLIRCSAEFAASESCTVRSLDIPSSVFVRAWRMQS